MSRRLESPEEARKRLSLTPMTERERAALWARIDESVAHRRGTARALWLAVPALGAAALGLFLWRSPAPTVPGPDATELADRAPGVSPDCRLDPLGARWQLSERCGQQPLSLAGDEWTLSPGAAVERTAQGARVRAGRVRFKVRPRRDEPAFEVAVSEGDIRVIGTVFHVEEHAGRGSVHVSEGVIEFTWHDGTRERVAAGQTLHWPRPAAEDALATEAAQSEDEASGAQDNPRPVRARRHAAAHEGVEPAPAVDMDRVIARLLQLQSQQRRPEAIALLRETLAAPGLTDVQRARIRSELERLQAAP